MSAKAALQLAERGFFARELNAGWKEWKEGNAVKEGSNPVHSERVGPGEIRCSCSFP
jgi:hypothetical protein